MKGKNQERKGEINEAEVAIIDGERFMMEVGSTAQAQVPVSGKRNNVDNCTKTEQRVLLKSKKLWDSSFNVIIQ